jgi:hypothetical protein
MRICILLAFAGCSTEYGLSPTSDPLAPPRSVAIARAPEAPPLAPVSVQHDGGSATAAWGASDGTRVEEFSVGAGARTPVSDWLFVLDPSASMSAVIDRVQNAFGELAGEGIFPDEARVAVLYTTPMDPDRPGHLHPAARKTNGWRHEPGFGHLVSADRLTAFRFAAPERADRLPDLGCGEWFTPTEADAEGRPCFVGNTQISGSVVRAEAGLTALSQWLESTNHPFRAGAAVNVIFVSDTHDPGTDVPEAQDLVDHRPSVDELSALAERDQPLSAFRLHAIAPASQCVEKWAAGASYYDAAEQSGGWTVDLCTATDYRPLIRKIADEGSIPDQTVVALGRDAASIDEVTADGAAIGWSLSPDRRAIVLDLPAEQAAHVSVRYRAHRMLH